MRKIVLCTVLATVGCTDDGSKSPNTGASSNIPSSGSNDGGASICTPTSVELAAPPAHSGVVYMTHFFGNELNYYRIDGEHPRQVGTTRLSYGVQDMKLDAVNDLLFVAAETPRGNSDEYEVAIYRVDRPDSPDDELKAPRFLAAPTFGRNAKVTGVEVNPYTKRLYVATGTFGMGIIEEFDVWIYDYSNPASPKPAGSFTVKPQTYFDIDPFRNLFFIPASGKRADKGEYLHVYDLNGDPVKELDGSPYVLSDIWPPNENDSIGFVIAGITVDPYTNRVVVGRREGLSSEPMLLDYPADMPDGCETYSDKVSVEDFRPLGDPFPIGTEPAMRADIWATYHFVFDPDNGNMYFNATQRISPTTPSAILVGIDTQGELLKGCDDYKGFGCFARRQNQGAPGGYNRTEGNLCLDSEHNVVAMSSKSEDVGYISFFKVNDDGTASLLYDADGSSIVAGDLPTRVVCH